ncbi:MAG TPA: acetylxylan esterase [Verrucomicrobiae bacterium]|nr:acetylxylan esterase [Verrucomicrobiae bacterium]
MTRVRTITTIGLISSWASMLPAPVGADMTIYESACQQAREVSSASLAAPMPPAQWNATLAQRRQLWLEMLGLSPMPERTPLDATVTGVLERGDYAVEKVHFQSMPGAHVIGNLYRPAKTTGRLPAVLYLCGHSKGKVNPPYQANPRWFGQHGYVALVLDPIQLGESQGIHHGTYREDRWDWPSRGYTPAGTEVWNAIRALDYLESRTDVDKDRMGVTGLSGGGVISWCLGAADERVKVVVPVCQSGSIEHVVVDRATDGHCDCAFWINYYRWCWPDIGALIAPRAFLMASGSEDVLWRPYGYRDVAHRIRHQYAALGTPENFELVEDLTPHGYTPKLRQAIFTWFNRHLKGDPTPVTDDVTDFIEPEENLLVFGGKLPENDQMRRIETQLVKRAEPPSATDAADWRSHQKTTIDRLRELTFRHISREQDPRLRDCRADGSDKGGMCFGTRVFDNRDGLTLRIKTARPPDATWPIPTVAYAVQADARSTFAGGGPSRPAISPAFATAGVEVRNTGVTSVGPGYLWTLRRVYPLLGETLPERQVDDLLSGIALMRREPGTGPVALFGQGNTAPLAIYAAILDPQVSEVILASPPESHANPATPEFLGILRIGDLPQNLALLYPRAITFVGAVPAAYEWTRQMYEKLGAGDRIRVIPSAREWKPR